MMPKVFSTYLCIIAGGLLFLLSACGRRETENELTQDSLTVLSNVFRFEMASDWRTLRAGATKSILRSGGWTNYYVIHEGNSLLFRVTLTALEDRKGRTLLYDRFSSNPIERKPFSSWTPEMEGPGYWVSFRTKTNGIHYFWNLFLVDKITNALLYNEVMINAGAR